MLPPGRGCFRRQLLPPIWRAMDWVMACRDPCRRICASSGVVSLLEAEKRRAGIRRDADSRVDHF